MTDLLVSYPAGSTAESTVVATVTHRDGAVLFAVERTPCHPESPRWPDQPADRCTLEAGDGQTPVECLEGFVAAGELGLSVAQDRPAGAVPCVVHRVASGVEEGMDMAVGDKVSLQVDERYRRAVSRSHSRCHLVSLALNAALADAWREDKEPPARDSLGNPDFDKLAIVSSKIDEESSLDVYRVGRHVRKSGFAADSLGDPEALAERVAEIAKGWLQSSPEISVTPGVCRLEERRTWSCALTAETASFPCGGTHPQRMEPDEGLAVTIAWDADERSLRMRAKGSLFHV
jgi:alanyl-tRNA synthetase